MRMQWIPDTGAQQDTGKKSHENRKPGFTS